MGSSKVKEALKTLCDNNGWCYGAFWCFDQQNPMLVTMEDSYFKGKMGDVLRPMLVQTQMVGAGIVGYAAFTGEHQWIFSDSYGSERSLGALQDMFQDSSEICKQFSSGIKTIAVISVDSKGVVQFGSTKKIMERQEILDQTKKLFRDISETNELTLAAFPPSSSITENDDANEWLSTFCKGDTTPLHHTTYVEQMEALDDSTSLTQSSALLPDVKQERMSYSNLYSSYDTNMAVSTEAEAFISSHAFNQLQQMTLDFSPSDALASEYSSIVTWIKQNSLLQSFESPVQCELAPQGCSYAIPAKFVAPVACVSTESNYLQGLALNSFHRKEESVNVVRATEEHSRPFKIDDFTQEFSDSCAVDNFLKCFAPKVEQNIKGLETTISENPSPSGRPTSVLSGLIGDVSLEILSKQEANKGRSFMNGVQLSVSSGDSDCSPDMDVCSTVPQKGLFTELGLEALFGSINTSKQTSRYSNGNQLSVAKRKGVESLLCDVKHGRLATGCSNNNISRQPAYGLDNTFSLLSSREFVPELQVGSLLDDSYSINHGGAVTAKFKKPEESKKAVRKRARPGESTRPRPKDRQQIQDRIKELREIIPNGSKLSIDQLLDRAAKHIFFLHGVTKLADKLKQVDIPKLIEQESGMLATEKKPRGSGATWALEVGDKTMVCPIIVEDLSTPGLMLIEMLCEDHGLFLEIADTIKGFGLSVLKGVMERRADKIWAHFIVEAQKPVTRMEIFMDLVKHLKFTERSYIGTKNQLGSFINSGASLINDYDLHCHVSCS